ncbi:hypothetical protein CP556_03775 [Natrinema sp. CBA1119]|uniref:hypothetical protein n=1 Tax=Natrinema sp. CBA1119 TaxID=1608465 RepID=UPI000BFA0FB6|nr:hypothetical protein [Natrinema sp. CBA1119]PGF15333.1 hypothetical protein CP556_03775 [Natrinema sp. CBA1119]
MSTTDSTTPDGTDAIDLTTRVRRRLLPALHRVKEPLGGYAICRQHPEEYVGIVKRGLDAVRSILEELTFEPEPIASLKVHDDGRRSAGSWVRRESTLAPWQLHVTLFRTGEGTVEVFAHREYSWLRHPYKHYTQAGWDGRGGVERMRAMLSTHGVPFRIE